MIDSFLPMLATSSLPFDSSEHVFEVKWDGVRSLAAVADGHWRLWGRHRTDYTDRYPELAVLRRLPAGTVVDGELVVLQEGRADFPALLRRHQLLQPERIRQSSRHSPVHYLLFDLLYHQGQSLCAEPLWRRRVILADVVAAAQDPRLVFSEGVVGFGEDFFDRVVAQGHEGVMAKLLTSRYQPAKRSAAWKKIKPVQEIPCVIIGYTPAGEGIHSLLVATAQGGNLRYVGELTRGFLAKQQRDLVRRLEQRTRLRPVVVCSRHARWLEPDLYCRVRFFGWTNHGHLRHAVFRGLIEDKE
jgi:DNA ligase D-like protein (predicted ligase)